MPKSVFDQAHQALSSGALAGLPLLYMPGEIVIHATLGPCQVLEKKGGRRLVEYLQPLKMPKEKHLAYLQDPVLMWAEEAEAAEVWVDLDALRWMDKQFMETAKRTDNDLGFVRLAWLQTLDEETRSRYTLGIDYAALRFERED
jgi:hypothetical protein